MKTSDFHYYLPERNIAYYPLSERHKSKLIVVNRNKASIEHKRFFELPDLLSSDDLVVLNNTKVIPARLIGSKKSSGSIEILLIEKLNETEWKCLARRPKNGMEVEFSQGIAGKLMLRGKDEWTVQFNDVVDDKLDLIGRIPLPPYIKREVSEADKVSYQTIYAECEGAVAAPTAGLHFTPDLLDQIKRKGTEVRFITLHVGVGTFAPVKTDAIERHRMHGEYKNITNEVAGAINRAKREGRRVIAVGTTVVRALESSADENGYVAPVSGRTNLFITPGFQFRVIGGLITNLHLPCSTLLMLVSAFAGHEITIQAYNEAREKDYRFLSYGDSMFIN